MSTTREEAIRALRVDDGLEIRGSATRLGEFLQGLFVAIAALRGRLKFGGAKNSAPFPSMVVVFRPKMEMLEGME